MQKIYHNKKSNTGLLFELLIQQVILSTIEKNDIKAKKALYLIKKYFKNGTELNEELQLINTIIYNETSKWNTASRLLSEILSAAKKLDIIKLKNEKFHLLTEINTNFNKTFFDSHVPNYKVYSSLYSLIESYRKNQVIFDAYQKIKLEETVLNHLLDNTEVKRINEFAKNNKNNEDIDDLVFHFIIKKFNQNWNEVLNESQKEILREYINCTSDRKFDNFIDKKKKKIENELYEAMKKTKDKNLLQKLYEAMQKLTNIFNFNKDKKTEILMTYNQLIEELKK